jgi:hypothetical protein
MSRPRSKKELEEAGRRKVTAGHGDTAIIRIFAALVAEQAIFSVVGSFPKAESHSKEFAVCSKSRC